MNIERILAEHKKWLYGDGGQRANLQGAVLWGEDLRSAILRRAILRRADLRKADLRRIDLRGADLREANLLGADLREANLRRADLRRVNLRGTDLREADLGAADLREADLDFSAWSLSCGSFDAKVDDRIVAQLFAHIARLDVSGCSSVMRYAHWLMFSSWPGTWFKNLFCTYRDDVSKI